jgi:hypothetical protein
VPTTYLGRNTVKFATAIKLLQKTKAEIIFIE